MDYSILQQHDLSMRQLNLKADHDNTIMTLNDMVEALVRADIEATEFLMCGKILKKFITKA